MNIKNFVILIVAFAVLECIACVYVIKSQLINVASVEKINILSDIHDIDKANHIHWLLSPASSDMTAIDKIAILKKIVFSNKSKSYPDHFTQLNNRVLEGLSKNTLPDEATIKLWLIDLQHMDYILEKQKNHNKSAQGSIIKVMGNTRLIFSSILFIVAVCQLMLGVGYLSGLSNKKTYD